MKELWERPDELVHVCAHLPVSFWLAVVSRVNRAASAAVTYASFPETTTLPADLIRKPEVRSKISQSVADLTVVFHSNASGGGSAQQDGVCGPAGDRALSLCPADVLSLLKKQVRNINEGWDREVVVSPLYCTMVRRVTVGVVKLDNKTARP